MTRLGRLHVWHCWATGPDGAPVWFAAVDSTLHADRERIERPETEALALVGDSALGVVRLGPEGRPLSVELRAGGGSSIEELWFYLLPEPAATPPAAVLMAFAGHGVPAGGVRRDGDLGDPPVGSADQLGAVRWYPATGEVDQIYVAPRSRRRGVASALVVAAGLLTTLDAGPRLWGDGQRTDLGEAWVAEQFWSGRAAARTHVSPPMTPGDDGA